MTWVDALKSCGVSLAGLEEWTGIDPERLLNIVEGRARPTAIEFASIMWALTENFDGLPDDAEKLEDMRLPRPPRDVVLAALEQLFADVARELTEHREQVQ